MLAKLKLLLTMSVSKSKMASSFTDIIWGIAIVMMKVVRNVVLFFISGLVNIKSSSFLAKFRYHLN